WCSASAKDRWRAARGALPDRLSPLLRGRRVRRRAQPPLPAHRSPRGSLWLRERCWPRAPREPRARLPAPLARWPLHPPVARCAGSTVRSGSRARPRRPPPAAWPRWTARWSAARWRVRGRSGPRARRRLPEARKQSEPGWRPGWAPLRTPVQRHAGRARCRPLAAAPAAAAAAAAAPAPAPQEVSRRFRGWLARRREPERVRAPATRGCRGRRSTPRRRAEERAAARATSLAPPPRPRHLPCSAFSAPGLGGLVSGRAARRPCVRASGGEGPAGPRSRRAPDVRRPLAGPQRPRAQPWLRAACPVRRRFGRAVRASPVAARALPRAREVLIRLAAAPALDRLRLRSARPARGPVRLVLPPLFPG